MRVNKKELQELVEEIEAGGGDATDLKALLVEAPEPEVERAPRRNSRFREEKEETIEERLARRVGDLFPNGIPLQEILDYDYRFTLNELRAMCRKAGFSISGDKKELAAKLIANSVEVGDADTYKGGGI